jgi:hypothetical protein
MRQISIHLCLFMALFQVLSCGEGSSVGPRNPFSLHSEWLLESAPDSLAEAVVVDSVFWNPAALLPTGDPSSFEVEGLFLILLHNTATESLQMRYDLRFLDEDDFLVDRFIPFGQPVLLAAGQSSRLEGRFVIRSTPDIGRFGLLTMRIAVRLTRPQL